MEFSQQTKEEYQQKRDARRKEMDSEIVNLQEKGQALKDDAKEKWEENKANLQTKRDVARARLAEVKDSGAEAWKDLQSGARAASEEMDAAFHKASSES